MDKKSIFIVEDDVDLCNLISQTLFEKGYTVIASAEFRDAGFRLKNQRYHCILLDMLIGEESGEELLNSIRERRDSPNKDTPVLVISGFLDSDLVQKIAPKIQGALVKPFDLKALLEQVKKLAK